MNVFLSSDIKPINEGWFSHPMDKYSIDTDVFERPDYLENPKLFSKEVNNAVKLMSTGVKSVHNLDDGITLMEYLNDILGWVGRKLYDKTYIKSRNKRIADSYATIAGVMGAYTAVGGFSNPNRTREERNRDIAIGAGTAALGIGLAYGINHYMNKPDPAFSKVQKELQIFFDKLTDLKLELIKKIKKYKDLENDEYEYGAW